MVVRWRAVGDRVERPGNVCILGAGRGLLERAELVFARVLFFVLSGEAEATLTALAAIVRPLVSINASLVLVMYIQIVRSFVGVRSRCCVAVLAVWFSWRWLDTTSSPILDKRNDKGKTRRREGSYCARLSDLENALLQYGQM